LLGRVWSWWLSFDGRWSKVCTDEVAVIGAIIRIEDYHKRSASVGREKFSLRKLKLFFSDKVSNDVP
jgi:hypothetical protein